MTRTSTTRALLVVLVLILAGCSSADGTTAALETDVAAETTTTSSDTGSDEPGSDEPGSDEPAAPTTTETAPVTTEPPTAPQPVTASTVHETRSDDFPDILAAQATSDGDGSWRFDVTVSSPYDTPERYADAWRVVGPDGAEFGIRVLTHDHANEQPFTRSQSGIAIPADVTEVTVEGRDLANGWGGGTLSISLTPVSQ